ncbi:hypothetical protein OH764_36635 (plasmid) [Burkholderia sp. M6-3]
MRDWKNQHATIVAKNEVARLTSRLLDVNRRYVPRRLRLGLRLNSAGTQRRTACCEKQHHQVGHGMNSV